MANLTFLCDYSKVLSNYSNCRAHGWKLVGQEQDGTLLASWEMSYNGEETNIITSIGLYNDENENFEILHSFKEIVNVVQASINSSKTILIYVTRICAQTNEELPDCYVFNTILLTTNCTFNCEINITSEHQVMAQFLYRKKGVTDRFLTFVHKEGINLYQINTEATDEEILQVSYILVENVVKTFSWAQWDAEHQCLYYIHYRKTTKSDEIGEKQEENISPTLSSLQFNDDFPHEMVLNIPLNLPSTLDSPFNLYEDEPIPLRVHDSSLNVIVLSDSRGIVCICHHYLCQPVKTPLMQNDTEEHTTVHLAYSVTLLHRGMLIHCRIPGIPWAEASELRPTFAIHEQDYLFVYLPGLFMHLLDLGLAHQPCHILLPQKAGLTEHWTPIKTTQSFLSLLNSKTLKIFTLEISTKELMDVFYNANIGIYNKLSIIHYFLVHRQDFDSICQLLSTIAEYSLNPSLQQIFHEILVSGTYASVVKSLPNEASKPLQFLPLTTINYLPTIEIKGASQTMTLTQEALWHPSVMLLTPQQRLCQFRVDLWTQLWNLIAESSCISRFKPSTVAEKLMVSLVCYQPEALSRCSTPLSPGSGFSVNAFLMESANIGNYKAKHLLPFFEIEKCTASKQEHVISVNLRELSIHLVKHGLENPLQVHVVATRYAAAQLEMSRFLCSLITRSCAIPVHQVKGFQLIDELPMIKKKVYFAILERYASAIDKLAYPTPQGFSSFFTYLAYKTLPFNTFVQYTQARALSLQIDVMKIILPDLGDDFNGVKKKLRLLQLLPRSRAKRLLNQWSHPMSLILRAREHSQSILSGLEPRTYPPRICSMKDDSSSHKLFNSADGVPGLEVVSKGSDQLQNRYPPLDSFLDLLTAKANGKESDGGVCNLKLNLQKMMATK